MKDIQPGFCPPASERLIQLLRCTRCQSHLSMVAVGLVCNSCGAEIPVREGIPRFVDRLVDAVAARTQASFGYEWTNFNQWQESGEQNFRDYFDHLDLASLAGRRVLDAGCGIGRHARYVADFADHVVAVDFSVAVDQARRNTADCVNVDCVQADLTCLPFTDGTFDYAYSIGVLHHIPDTPGALRDLVEKVKVGGRVRVYLYWRRTGVSGALLRLVDVARAITTRLPFPFLRFLCWCLSLLLMAGVVWPYRLLSAIRVVRHRHWPLFVYSNYPFRILFNDQFDRFSAPVEQRFSQDEVRRLLEGAGLDHVMTYARFGWVAEGTRRR